MLGRDVHGLLDDDPEDPRPVTASATVGIIEPDAARPDADKRGRDWAASESPTANQAADACVRRGADKCWYFMDSVSMHGGPGDMDERVRQRHREAPKGVDWSMPRDPGAAGIHFAACVITEESFMDLATKLLEEQMGITEQLPLPLDEKR
jgi:hypothetical protein